MQRLHVGSRVVVPSANACMLNWPFGYWVYWVGRCIFLLEALQYNYASLQRPAATYSRNVKSVPLPLSLPPMVSVLRRSLPLV